MKSATNHQLYIALTRTPTHVGCGQGLGDIDLPVIRNAWGLPILPGSSIKGVLRQYAPTCWGVDSKQVKRLFGPDRKSAKEHAGMFAPQDALLLAMPVATLRGGWAWLSCPRLLQRYRRDALAAGLAGMPVMPSRTIGSDELFISAEGSRLFAIEIDRAPLLVLGESAYAAVEIDAVGLWARHLAPMAFPHDESAWVDSFAHRLVVAPDDVFMHHMLVSTEVRSRVALEDDKLATGRALWREECVPADSLFWGLMSMLPVAAPAGEPPLSVASAMALVKPACVQLGGKASVGYGWVDFMPQLPSPAPLQEAAK